MGITPEKLQIIYQSLMQLGSYLSDARHVWTNAERFEFENAEKLLRPFVDPNVIVHRLERSESPSGTAG